MKPSRLHRLFCSLAFVALIASPCLRATPQNSDWNVALLNQILASVQPRQTLVNLDDMQISVANLTAWRNQLAHAPSPQLAFDGTAATWPGGNVYYSFSMSSTNAVPANFQKAFLDAANEWASFANLHFIPRTTQSNYVTVQVNGGLEGGQSAVGMIGGQQFLSIGPTAWNRGTICHEIGHTLGLVHEHQRSDRDSYVTILTNNIVPGGLPNFVILDNSRNETAYDFLSVMHYSHNYLSIDPDTLNTIQPLPPYLQFLNLMGEPNPVVLSYSDRAGMADVYGAGPAISAVVTNTQDSGPGSLRTALYYAFDHPGTEITFNIATNDPGYTNGVFTIQPSDQLPWLVNATFLNGASQPSSNPNGPSILISGALAPVPSTYANGLQLGGTNWGGTNCTAHSIVINNFTAAGFLITGSNTTGNAVAGCYISVDASGSVSVTNGLPVTVSAGAHGNMVGGGNIISGGAFQGLVIRDPGTTNNIVAGNYIGLNAGGAAALSNTWAGIEIFNGAQGNTIGGTSANFRNVISGNGLQGILISDPQTTGNVVEGNFIGTDVTGSFAIANGWAGVNIGNSATGNFIGPRNVISGNGEQGVAIGYTGANGNVVEGNFIGLNATGTAAIPNTWSGINIFGGAQGNIIGGTVPGSANIISGNSIQGISFQDAGTALNLVEGNWIGLDATGTNAIPNLASGVEMFSGAQSNIVGGIGARNYISGNDNYGVLMDDSASANIVQGNTLGLSSVNNSLVPNAYSGLALFGGATSNAVGGITPGAANLIVGNLSGGIDLFDATTSNNVLRANSISSNAYVGIGIYTDANQSASESAPSITSAVVTTNTTIAGTLASVANITFAIDFYAGPAPASDAQASTYLGAVNVTTGSSGSANFSANVASVVAIGEIITATATDPFGNTSSLSAGMAVTGTDSAGDGITDAWRLAHFGGTGTTTNSLSCAACDPDHDGFDNHDEFLAGTDPNNPASKLLMGAPSADGSAIVVNFPSVQGIVYRVEYKDNLAFSGWSLLADQILGTGGVISLTDPGVGHLNQRYYRLAVLP